MFINGYTKQGTRYAFYNNTFLFGLLYDNLLAPLTL